MFTDYMRELQKVELLSGEEEALRWHRFRREGDPSSRGRLIEAYQPLVFKVVMSLRPPDRMLMDMIQEGTIGLIEAVERFDHERGVRFSTYATYRIRGRVLNTLRRDRAQEYALGHDGRRDLALAASLADPASEAALAGVEDAVLLVQMHEAIDALPDRERAILRATFVDARAPRSVAGELRISLSHFYRLQKQALAHVRAFVLDDGRLHQLRRATGY